MGNIKSQLSTALAAHSIKHIFCDSSDAVNLMSFLAGTAQLHSFPSLMIGLQEEMGAHIHPKSSSCWDICPRWSLGSGQILIWHSLSSLNVFVIRHKNPWKLYVGFCPF